MFKQFLAYMAILMMFVSMNSVQAGIKEDGEKIKAMFAKQMPDLTVTEINKTPIDSLYEVIAPPQIFYISQDAKYVVSGNIINIETGQNLTMPQRDKVRAQAVEMLGEESMIVFGPKKVKIGRASCRERV